MTGDLESLTPGLFAACDQALGDTITIVPPGADAEAITLKVNADYSDMKRDYGLSAAVVQDSKFDCDASKLPAKPGKGWRVTLHLLPGRTFEPRDVERDRSGLRWEFGLTEIFGA